MGKRKRDRDECERARHLVKKDRGMEKKREKIERRYMGKEDVRVVAATLAPPSSNSASLSFPSFAPTRMKDALQLEANILFFFLLLLFFR